MKHKLVVLTADDDPNDRHLMKHAIQRKGAPIELRQVNDGAELTEYMKGKGQFADRHLYPLPDLIILDLNFSYVLNEPSQIALCQLNHKEDSLPLLFVTSFSITQLNL